jgi:hypothetical protein
MKFVKDRCFSVVDPATASILAIARAILAAIRPSFPELLPPSVANISRQADSG